MPLPVFSSAWPVPEPSAMFAWMLRSALPCPRATEKVWLPPEPVLARFKVPPEIELPLPTPL